MTEPDWLASFIIHLGRRRRRRRGQVHSDQHRQRSRRHYHPYQLFGTCKAFPTLVVLQTAAFIEPLHCTSLLANIEPSAC